MDCINCKMRTSNLICASTCYLKEKNITSSFLSNYVTYVFGWSVNITSYVTFYIITTAHAPNEMYRSELYYYISGSKVEEAEL